VILDQELADVLSADPPPEAVVDHVGLERVGPVAVLTLARPEQLNAMSLAGWRRIADAADGWRRDEALRAVVLRGAGDRAFGAGADIKEFPSVRMTASQAVHYNESVARALETLAAVPVPVVAAIDGLAVGGGLELSAAADVRLATDRSRFGLPIGRLGVTLGYTEASALTRLIGPSALKYLLFSGEIVDAAHAGSIGLVQRVVAADQLLPTLLRFLDSVTRASLPTLVAGKAVADMTMRPLTAHDTEVLSRIAVEVYSGPDLAEGVAAFLDGRSPQFPSQQHRTPVA
jgi:enoyl-CoA hydratase